MASSRKHLPANAKSNHFDPLVTRATTDLAQIGYARLPGLLDRAQTDTLRQLLEEQIECLKGSRYPGFSEARPDDGAVFNLQAKDKRFIDVLGNPILEHVLVATLNDPNYRQIPAGTPNYILGGYNARASGKALGLHIDSWIPLPGPRTFMVQVAFVLDTRGEEDGCTLVVPGSHCLGEYSDRQMSTEPGTGNAVSLTAKPGDVLIWDSRLWHGAAENKSDHQSWVLVATMQMWWVKPRTDIPRTIPPHIFDALSDRQKALMGFCSMPPIDEFISIEVRAGYDMIPETSLV